MLRPVLATLGGIFAGVLVISLIQMLSHAMYPLPDGMDPENYEELAKHVQTLPLPAFLLVLLSWFSGCFVGTYLARLLAPERNLLPCLIVAALLLAATVVTLASLPHPLWMWPVALIGCPVFGFLGILLAAPKEYVIAETRRIKAPIEKVFRTLASVEHFSEAVEGIEKIEFLSESKYGAGTRFRETRIMNGREASTELEVTELVENDYVRIVSDAGGTLWDTVFKVDPKGEEVEMTMQMDVRPHDLFAKFLTPLILNMVGNAVASDMDAVKQHCEQGQADA